MLTETKLPFLRMMGRYTTLKYMKKVAIVGHGYVGRAVREFFEGKFEVVVYDPAQGHSDKEAVQTASLAMICVPTPMSDDGSVDLSAVEEVFSWLKTPAIAIKSTVPPGTTKALAEKFSLQDRLVFTPEYIGEGGYPVPFWEGVPHPTDMKQHQFHIFGGSREAANKVMPFFQKVSGAFAKYHQTDSTTAETVKYMTNVWIAAKVTFCNEFFDIAENLGVDYNELRELWLQDGRVGRSHTVVYPDHRGFTGKCIPKDTNGLYRNLQKSGHESDLIKALLRVNKKFTDKNSK